MNMDRRTFLKVGAAAAATMQLRGLGEGDRDKEWNAQWIWYPGQLAAYRHARRIHLAVQRCTNVGYGKFSAATHGSLVSKTREGTCRHCAAVGNSRGTCAHDRGRATRRHHSAARGSAQRRVGHRSTDRFAEGLPCLLLEGGALSTGGDWEASLDGEHWVGAETGGGNNPRVLPDAPREIVVSLPVVRVLEREGSSQRAYALAGGRELLLDFRETELGALCLAVRGKGELNIQVGESLPEVRDPDPRYFEQYPLEPIQLSEDVQHITLPERALRFARLSVSG